MNLKIMKTKYLMIATVAMLFTACSNDTEVVNDGPVAAQVNAEIYNMATSRAYDDDWEKTDAIGISVAGVANQGATAGTNVKYTRKSDNKGFEASSPIYFQDKEEVTFRAYYPFTETTTMTEGKIISASTADQTQQSTFDFMFATDAKAKKEAPAINFTENSGGMDCRFKHCMSQLQLEFHSGHGIELTSKSIGYKVIGLNMAGTFDIETGVAAANTAATDIKDLSFDPVTATGSSITKDPIILFPQSVMGNKFNIEVTVNQQTYEAELTLPESTDLKFKAGYRLFYVVTINKTGLTIGDAEIEDWISETHQGDATMK